MGAVVVWELLWCGSCCGVGAVVGTVRCDAIVVVEMVVVVGNA